MRSRLILTLALLVLTPLLSGALPADGTAALLKQIDAWSSRDRIDLARNGINKLLRIQPDNPEAVSRLAFLELKAQRLPEAQAALDRLKAIDPQHPQIANISLMLRLSGPDRGVLQQARLLARAGRTSDAIAAFDRLFPNGMSTPELAYEYWLLVADTPDGWSRAREGFRQLTQQYPESMRYRLAWVEHELIRDPGNRELLETLFEFLQDARYEQQAMGTWRRAILRLDEAEVSIPYYEEYLEKNPKDSMVQALLAGVEAAVSRRRSLAQDPTYRIRQQGLKWLEAGQSTKAERAFRKVLKAWPNDAEALGGLGMIKLRQGSHNQAQRYFEQAQANDPDNAGKWRSLNTTARFWGLLAAADDLEAKGQTIKAQNALEKALRLEPNQPDALAARAGLHARQGQESKSRALYSRALNVAPDNGSALRGLVNLYLDTDQTRLARQTLDGLTRRQHRALGDSFRELQVSTMRQEADLLSADGHTAAATEKMEQADRLAPNDAWILYDLARLYRQQGRAAAAMPLFESALQTKPDDNELRYAYGLFLAAVEREDEALNCLSGIPAAQRTENMQATIDRLTTNRVIARTLERYQAGNAAGAQALLSDLERRMTGKPERQFAIASAWSDINQPDRAIALLETLAADPRFADSGTEVANQTQAAEIRLSQARLYRKLGQPGLALERLSQARQLHVNAVDRYAVDLETARIYQSIEQPAKAAEFYQQALRVRPDDVDTGFALVYSLDAAGLPERAMHKLQQLSARIEPLDVGRRLDLVKAWDRLDLKVHADAELRLLHAVYPDNAEVLYQVGRRAEARGDAQYALDTYTAARAVVRTTGQTRAVTPSFDLPDLDRRIDKLTLERSGEFNMAYDMGGRNATSGKSTLTISRVPMELKLPAPNNGHWFLRAEPTRLTANSLDLNDRAEVVDFGQGLFCFPACANAGTGEQTARGTAFAVGYEREGLRVDIGTTPLGFLVEDIVGGVVLDGDLGIFSWSVEIARRPMTSSMLTYAGAIDPNTGSVWGGVRTNGVTFGLSYDEGGPYGIWSNLDLHHITGKNVLSNNRARLMGGVYWKLVNQPDRHFSVGLNAGAWYHQYSLDEFTYGQGGYYSPNRYASVSLPLDYYARLGQRLSYRVRGSVSYSVNLEERTPFYPADSTLQAAAEALQGTTGTSPYFDDGIGKGLSYSALVAVEYKLTDRLAVGLEASLERSDYYEPNKAIVYLRYRFADDQGPVRSPPVPMVPYSDF